MHNQFFESLFSSCKPNYLKKKTILLKLRLLLLVSSCCSLCLCDNSTYTPCYAQLIAPSYRTYFLIASINFLCKCGGGLGLFLKLSYSLTALWHSLCSCSYFVTILTSSTMQMSSKAISVPIIIYIFTPRTFYNFRLTQASLVSSSVALFVFNFIFF